MTVKTTITVLTLAALAVASWTSVAQANTSIVPHAVQVAALAQTDAGVGKPTPKGKSDAKNETPAPAKDGVPLWVVIVGILAGALTAETIAKLTSSQTVIGVLSGLRALLLWLVQSRGGNAK